MTFISNYWWAILAIAAAIIVTWRSVRRISRSVTVGAPGVDVRSSQIPALRLYLVLLAAAALAPRSGSLRCRHSSSGTGLRSC